MNVNKTKLSRLKYATPIDVLNHAPIGQQQQCKRKLHWTFIFHLYILKQAYPWAMLNYAGEAGKADDDYTTILWQHCQSIYGDSSYVCGKVLLQTDRKCCWEAS